MIRARQPERIIPLHPAETDQDILQRFIERMAHVKLPCNIGRRDHNGIGFLLRVELCMEIVSVQPELIDAVFHILRAVLFGQFLCHPLISSSIRPFTADYGHFLFIIPFGHSFVKKKGGAYAQSGRTE